MARARVVVVLLKQKVCEERPMDSDAKRFLLLRRTGDCRT